MTETTRAGAALRMTGIAMLAALSLFSAMLLVESHQASRTKGAVTAHRAAHVVATQFSWLFEASVHVLQRIESSVATAGPNGRTGPIQSLPNAVRDLPPGLGYAVFDSTGRLTHSGQRGPRPVWIADRAYFHAARDGQELVFSPMLTDRQTGERAMVIARRLDATGGFDGVATVTIPVSKLAELAASIGMTGHSTVGLVRADGMLLARAPPIAPMDLSDSPLFAALASGTDGSYETVSPADGVQRIVGFWKMDRWPVIAIAGLDRDAALADFRATLRTALLIVLPVLFGMGWLLHGLLRLMRQDEARRAALQAANDRANFLLREVHHRLKNNLQTVASLIRLESCLPEDTKTSLLGRLTAMVAAHEAMYGSDQFEEICVAPYLERLLADITRSQGRADVALHIDIAPVRLRGERAMLLGLLVNELVSNAWKHAFNGRISGRLDVAMAEAGDGLLRLVVSDDGPGYRAADTRRGMGSRLIEAFAAQLGGTARIETEGATTVTVTFPKIYGTPDTADAPPPPQPRAAHPATSAKGARSSAAMRSSKPARSSRRT